MPAVRLKLRQGRFHRRSRFVIPLRCRRDGGDEPTVLLIDLPAIALKSREGLALAAIELFFNGQRSLDKLPRLGSYAVFTALLL